MRTFIALLLVAVASAELAPLLKVDEPIPGKYIIKLKDDVDIDEIASTVRISGGKVSILFRNVLRGFAAELSDKVLDAVRRLPAVEYVEQNGVVRAMAVESWGLDRIDQRNLPLDDEYKLTGGGSGVVVWILDTGVRATHTDFGGRAVQDKSVIPGELEDGNGHGTHCAGTVGGSTFGVANGVEIRGVKVLSNAGSGSYDQIIEGMDYVADNANDGQKHVASMSLGGGKSTSLNDAVQRLVDAGVPVAVAAGNSRRNACNFSPASAPNAVTVGSTDIDDGRSSYSNYGSCLDIFAPGRDITSAWYTSDTATNTISGTSMACPHVAGALAIHCGNGMTGTDAVNKIVADATADVVGDPRNGSPNLLLFVQ